MRAHPAARTLCPSTPREANREIEAARSAWYAEPKPTEGVIRVMDPDRARHLLVRERSRIEAAFSALNEDGPLEGSDRREPGERDSEDLYQDEFDEGHRAELRDQLAALERAEERLAAGTYGLSIESGDPIPDGRLEALPMAERTAEEDERYRHAPG